MQASPLRLLRVLLVSLTGTAYVLLFLLNWTYLAAPHAAAVSSAWLRTLEQFAFSAFIGLLFLIVGTLVWLYHRDRLVAWLLWIFSLAMMVTFLVQEGAERNVFFFSLVSGLSSATSVFFLVVFLLVFPRNLLFEPQHVVRGRLLRFCLRGYTLLLTLLWLAEVVWVVRLQPTGRVGFTADRMGQAFYALAALGILTLPVVSYGFGACRVRVQLRYLALGVFLGVAPVLVLTIIPLAFAVPARMVVDARISTIPFVFLPLTLGYAVLRYQLRILDSSVRQACAWSLGTISSILLAFIVVVTSSLAVHGAAATLLSIAIALTVLSPGVWWLAQVLTRRLFAEQAAFEQEMQRDTHETAHLTTIAGALTQSFAFQFGTRACALLVLEEDTGYFQLVSSVPDAAAGRALLAQLLSSGRQVDGLAGESLWFEWTPQALKHLKSAKQPVLLRDVQAAGSWHTLSSYILPVTSHADLLCVPIRLQEQLIAVLVSGARQDSEWYAGPDFQLIADFIRRFGFASRLQTARIAAQTDQHGQMLQELYRIGSRLDMVQQTSAEGARTLAQLVSRVMRARVEIWLCRQEATDEITCIAAAGTGPASTLAATLKLAVLDWTPSFYEPQHALGGPAGDLPLCLHTPVPTFPLAWLPLSFNQHIGVLIITFPRMHAFRNDEQGVLITFAAHCAVALETIQALQRTRQALVQHQADRAHQRQLTQQVIRALEQLVQQERAAPEQGRVWQWSTLGLLVESFQQIQHLTSAPRLPLHALALHAVWLEALAEIPSPSDRVIGIEEQERGSTYVLADREALKLVVGCLLSTAFAGGQVRLSIHGDDTQVVMDISGQGSSMMESPQERAAAELIWLLCQRLVAAMAGRLSAEPAPGGSRHALLTLKRDGDTIPSFPR